MLANMWQQLIDEGQAVSPGEKGQRDSAVTEQQAGAGTGGGNTA